MLHDKRQYRKYEKNAKRERRRWRKRFIKNVARKADRNYRRALRLFFLLTLLYLLAVVLCKEHILKVREEKTIVFREKEESTGDGMALEILSKIIVRLKTGELVFYHERKEDNGYKDRSGSVIK